MKILIISPFLPYPIDDGDKIRLYNLLKRLAKDHEISLISFINLNSERSSVNELKKYCSRVETVLRENRSRLNKLLMFFPCLFSRVPAESKLAFENKMVDIIRRIVGTNNFDIIQIEHPFMAPYIKFVPKSYNTKTIIVVHNIGFIQYRRMFMTERKLISKIRMFANWVTMKKWEVKEIEKFDKCITVSTLNMEILNSLNSKIDISVIENGVDIDLYKPLPINVDLNRLLIVGSMDYEANHDAALYFYDKIFPLIRKQIPNSELFIVGRRPFQKVKDLAEDQKVVVTGYVNEVLPFYQCCDVTVVPLRAGGGTRLKILESMALGRPVVSTSIGCEGLDVVDGEHLLVADSPKLFSEHVVRLLSDRKLYEHIRTNARQLVVSRYDWDVITKQLHDVYNEVAL
jgi:glycosyltransferase involved in cell wall biosynthesis